MFVPAICPNCGGTLEIDDKQEAAVCKYCSTPFIAEKAINNYIMQNDTYIENATIVNKDSAETLLQKGITQIKIGQYEDAEETFCLMSKEYPENWKAWFGIALANLYLYPEDGFVIDDGIYSIIPDEVQDELLDDYAPIEIADIERLEKKICKTRANTDAFIEDKESVDEELDEITEDYNFISKRMWWYTLGGFICGGGLFVAGFSSGATPLVTLVCISLSICIIYWISFNKPLKMRLERLELRRRMDELKEEQKYLAKKIESGENKYDQLISDQENLNVILDDKLAQKGVSTAYEYYLNMLLEN